MSKFDENLFGRLAVLNRYVTKDQLAECLLEQKRSGKKEPIGQILLARGYIDEQQLDAILEIRNRKVKKLLRSADDSKDADRALAELVLRRGALPLDDLESAVMEQHALRRLNLHFCLVEVLLARGLLTPERAQELLGELGLRLARCDKCDSQYRVIGWSPRGFCPSCGEELVAPRYFDPVLVDGIVECDQIGV